MGGGLGGVGEGEGERGWRCRTGRCRQRCLLQLALQLGSIRAFLGEQRQLQHAEQAVERRAHLVRHAGKEVVLRASAGACRAGGGCGAKGRRRAGGGGPGGVGSFCSLERCSSRISRCFSSMRRRAITSSPMQTAPIGRPSSLSCGSADTCSSTRKHDNSL